MKTTMTRSVKGRVRYYTLELIPNLFGEWMLMRTYGSIKQRKPTGVIREIYDSVEEAFHSMQLLIRAKEKKRVYAVMIKQGLSAGIFYIPPIIAGVGAHTIQEIEAALFLFAIAFTAAAIIFYPDSAFSKRVLDLF